MAQSLQLREQAERCRRLARDSTDTNLREPLLAFAGEYAAQAAALEEAMGDAALERVLAAAESGDGDLLLAVADRPAIAAASLAALRVAAAKEIGAVDTSKHAFCWITEFPLFGLDEKSGAWFPMNNPFTSPRGEDLDLL